VAQDAGVGLGHTRLAIVDVPGGRQPMANEDGSIQAVVNGEFYGWASLRAELESRGHRFRSHCDSELLVHLYEEEGIDCLEGLRGEFAFVLWDQKRGRLFAARDRFGVKPLVFGRGPRGQLGIASEAKALFAMGFPASWDVPAFAQVASHQYLAPGQTLFAGISMLRPGHYLLAEGESVREECYWSLDYPRAREESRSDAHYAREIRDLLEESVRLRLQGDHPVACYLSGGIDSSATAALAARFAHGPVSCFGIAFEEAAYDEHEDAAAFARSIGADFHPVPVAHDDIVLSLAEAVRFSEGLCINGQLSAKFLLSKATAAAGFKSVLVGEGADELFCGYSHLQRDYLASRARAGDLDARARLALVEEEAKLQSGVMFPSGPAPSHPSFEGLSAVPSALVAKLQTGARMQRFLSDEFLAVGATEGALPRFLGDSSIAPEIVGRHPVDQAAILWMRSALSTYILKTLGDGTEMAHSIEGRVPYLDHKLFEFARGIPASSKLRGGVAKSILRRACAGLLPEALRQRPKRPLLAPPIAGRRGTQGWEMALDLVHSQSFRDQPFWSAPRLGAWMASMHDADEVVRRAADPIVMLALSTHALQQAFSLKGDRID
jgi:asparagine synthase (glutamine-hydrolysing)